MFKLRRFDAIYEFMTSRHAVTVGITAARAQTSVYMNIDACVVDIRWPVSPRC